MEKTDIKRDILNNSVNIAFNGELYYTDAAAQLSASGSIYVPAENIINLMGASLEKTGENLYHAERLDGKSIDFETGKSAEKGNAYLLDDILPMIDIKELCAAFKKRVKF